MPPWPLAAWLVAAWCLWAAADARRGVPEGERGGVSIFPALPLFPALFWGLAWLVDRVAAPWGTRTVAGLHAAFAAALVASIVRNLRAVRRWP